jgi:hypothetical protein
MHFNGYGVFYLQFSHQLFQPLLRPTLEWYYDRNAKLHMRLVVLPSLHKYLKIIIISVKIM